MADQKETAINERLRHRWAAGRVVGHLNVRRCDECRGWHHREYHG